MSAAMLLLVLAVATWLVLSFDASRHKQTAIDWVQARYQRELAIDGAVELQLLPHPAVALHGVRLSAAGQPQQPFASIDSAALSLRLWPLLTQREVQIVRLDAKGVRVQWQRDAEGRSNIDDLLRPATPAEAGPQRSSPVELAGAELTDIELSVADAVSGVQGRFAIEQLTLGALGTDRPAPLNLKARAELRVPAVNAALELDTELGLQSPDAASAATRLTLTKTRLQLRGDGFDIQGLDAKLQADVLDLQLGSDTLAAQGLQLQFSGTRLGWRIDQGQLGLKRLLLDATGRRLELEQLSSQLKGRHGDTTLDAGLTWPALSVTGDQLQGGPLAGQVKLGGDQRLQLLLSSQAPSGSFERITVPALKVEVDGALGARAVKGQVAAKLVLDAKPLVAALDELRLALQFSDPSLPALALSAEGNARWSAQTAQGGLKGTLNDQRFEAEVNAALDRARPLVDVNARFATLDLGRFVAPARQGAAPAPMGATTPIDLAPLQLADARVRLSATQLLRPPYRVDDFELRAAIDDGVLDLQRLGGRAWGGRFDISGGANAGNGELRLRLGASGVDLRAMLADTTGFEQLHGRGRLDADLRSRGATVGAARAALSGSAALALEPAAVRGIDIARTLSGWRSAVPIVGSGMATDSNLQTDFSQLSTSFAIRNGVASSTDLDGRSPFLRVAGDGSIDLARGSVDYRLRATVINTASGRAGPEMVLLNGVTVPIAFSGPMGNVAWHVNWPAVTASVAARSAPNAVRGAAGAVTGVVGGTVRGIGRVFGSGGEPSPKPPP